MVHHLDHLLIFGPGHSQLSVEEKEALALNSAWKRQQNQHDSSVCTTPWQVGSFLYQKRENLGCSSSLSLSLTSVLIFCLLGVGIPTSLHPNPCTPPTLPVLLSTSGSLSSCGKTWFVWPGLRHHLPLLLHV